MAHANTVVFGRLNFQFAPFSAESMFLFSPPIFLNIGLNVLFHDIFKDDTSSTLQFG